MMGMKNLEKILSTKVCEIPPFKMDGFQQDILYNFYLEFFFKNGRFLITPQYGFIANGVVAPDEENKLVQLLLEKQAELEKLKIFLLYNLSLYSSLLETNSYYIELNKHLLIVRFLPTKNKPDHFEVKAYTVGGTDLNENYQDKIYLGRDFISLQTIERYLFGLEDMLDSLQMQLQELKSRLNEHLDPKLMPEIEKEYIQEIEELAADLGISGKGILSAFPTNIDLSITDRDQLIDANMKFRGMKHILIEIEESVRELESRLFEAEQARSARYATKFKKDITNDINYITFKINGRISDHVNGIRI